MNGKVNVMIVDDYDMVRMGLKMYLMFELIFYVMGEVGNGQDVFNQFCKLD